MDDPESKVGGLLASVRRIRDSVLALIPTRLELASIELQEEKTRFLDLLLRAAAVIVLGLMGLIVGTAWVVVLFWDYSPAMTLGIITIVYALGAFAFWSDLKKRLHTAPPPFADTLAEIKKDCECLQGKK